MKQYQEACVGGFIHNTKGEVLFVKRADNDDFLPGVWELPGGGVDFGESPQEALQREILEEVGLSVQVMQPLSVNWYFIEKKDEKIQRVETTFLCLVAGDGKVILSNEHSDYVWLSEGANTLEVTDYMRKIIDTCWKIRKS